MSEFVTQTSDGSIEMNFTWNKNRPYVLALHALKMQTEIKIYTSSGILTSCRKTLIYSCRVSWGLSPGKPGLMLGWMQIGGWIACPLPGPLPSQFPLSGHFWVSAASWWCWHKVLQCGLTDNRCRRLQNTWNKTSKSHHQRQTGSCLFSVTSLSLSFLKALAWLFWTATCPPPHALKSSSLRTSCEHAVF